MGETKWLPVQPPLKRDFCVSLCPPGQEWSDLDDWPEALQPEASQVGSDKRKRKSWWKDFQVPGHALAPQLLIGVSLLQLSCVLCCLFTWQVWAKVIYVLAVVTIIILILLVVSEYQRSAPLSVLATVFHL